uniref:Uncharacterized protein n=1 Tax=Tetranychus urticae TaxID=32264 RepID=T1JR93_TETUR
MIQKKANKIISKDAVQMYKQIIFSRICDVKPFKQQHYDQVNLGNILVQPKINLT